MITAYSRGHKVYYDQKEQYWRYIDNNNPIDSDRSCKKCGGKPTIDGHDTCLGHLLGITSACCGHGKAKGFAL